MFSFSDVIIYFSSETYLEVVAYRVKEYKTFSYILRFRDIDMVNNSRTNFGTTGWIRYPKCQFSPNFREIVSGLNTNFACRQLFYALPF